MTEPEPCPDWCVYQGHEHTVLRHRDPDEVARKLLRDAFFLRQHGERPPGAPRNHPDAETWRGWEMQVEVYLRTVDHFQAADVPNPDRLARAEALLAQIARVDAPARWRQTIQEQGFGEFVYQGDQVPGQPADQSIGEVPVGPGRLVDEHGTALRAAQMLADIDRADEDD